MEQSGTIECASFAYEVKLDSVRAEDLQPGDFLHLKTKRGTRYVFQTIMAEDDKRFIRCIYGRPILQNTSGQIRNESIEKNVPLIYGKSENFNQTSSIREIIVKRTDAPEINEKIYDKPLNELDVYKLEINDYIKVKTRNSTYVFKVTFIDDSSGMPFVTIVGGNNRFLRQKGRILNGVIEVEYPINTESVDTSKVEEIIISKSHSSEYTDPPNPFENFEGSMPHVKIAEPSPDISQKTKNPYFVTEKELIEAMGIENEENLNRATLETAWLYFEHMFENHLDTLGIVERISEKLRYERLKMGYKALMEKLDE